MDGTRTPRLWLVSEDRDTGTPCHQGETRVRNKDTLPSLPSLSPSPCFHRTTRETSHGPYPVRDPPTADDRNTRPVIRDTVGSHRTCTVVPRSVGRFQCVPVPAGRVFVNDLWPQTALGVSDSGPTSHRSTTVVPTGSGGPTSPQCVPGISPAPRDPTLPLGTSHKRRSTENPKTRTPLGREQDDPQSRERSGVPHPSCLRLQDPLDRGMATGGQDLFYLN